MTRNQLNQIGGTFFYFGKAIQKEITDNFQQVFTGDEQLE